MRSLAMFLALIGCASPYTPPAAPPPPPLPVPIKQPILSCPVGSEDSKTALDGLHVSVTSGSLTRAEETVAVCSAAWKECDKHTGTRPKGEASIRIEVGADGIVTDAVASATTATDDSWRSCIGTIASKLQFDPSSTRSTVVLTYRIAAFTCPPGVVLCY